jgi:hypothetical protein
MLLLLSWVLGVSTPVVAFAQSAGDRVVAATVEYASITEDDGFLGAGMGVAAGLGFRLTPATSVEVEVGVERNVRDLAFHAVAFDAQGHPAGFPFTERWEGTATFLLGSLSRTFGRSRAAPVVWGGGGLMHHGGTTRRPLTQPEIPPGFTLQAEDAAALAASRRGRATNALVADGGAGVEIRVSDRVTIRPFAALRLANTENVGPKYIIRGGARMAYQW